MRSSFLISINKTNNKLSIHSNQNEINANIINGGSSFIFKEILIFYKYNNI